MATTLDRRSFIAAGGGPLSLTALDMLAAQDALARHSRRDEPYGPLRRMPDQRGVEVPRRRPASATSRSATPAARCPMAIRRRSRSTAWPRSSAGGPARSG